MNKNLTSSLATSCKVTTAIIVAVAALAFVALSWFLPDRTPPVQVKENQAAVPVAVGYGNTSDLELLPELEVDVHTNSEQPAVNPTILPEVVATRRMYLAHAPLREPRIANPDSEANRQVLQSMVIKALTRSRSESGKPEVK